MLNTIVPIVIFIVILGIVIFVHELGHYLAAVKAGIFVEEFALGMGPVLYSFHGKRKSLHGKPKKADKNESDNDSSEIDNKYGMADENDITDEYGIVDENNITDESNTIDEDDTIDEDEGEYTLYSLRAFPLGGFCKMRGQDEDVPDDPEAMNNKSVLARIIVIAGGSFMNFLLAFILFFTLVMLRGFPVAEVWALAQDMPGYQAGLMVRDRITHINGTRVNLYEDFMFMMDVTGGQELNVRVNRGGQRYNFNITPVLGPNGYLIGFAPGRRFGILHTRPENPEILPGILFQRVRVPEGMLTSAEMIIFHIRAPFRLLARFVAGQTMPEGGGVVGFIGIGGMVTEIYQEVIVYGILDTLLTMILFTALLSAMLGIMNLLPIPALDGARLIFLFIEGIRRKPVAPEKEAMVHFVGIVSLILLAVFVAYRDILRLL